MTLGGGAVCEGGAEAGRRRDEVKPLEIPGLKGALEAKGQVLGSPLRVCVEKSRSM